MKPLYLRNRMCFPVKGYNRTILYDLNRQDYFFIPIAFQELLNTNNPFHLDFNEHEEWETFLIENEIIFSLETSKEAKLFPPVSTVFENPNLLSCIIIHDNLEENHLEIFKNIYLLNVCVIINQYDSSKTYSFLQKLTKYEIDSIYLYLIEEDKRYTKSGFDQLVNISQLFNIYLFGNSIVVEDNIKENKFYKPINIISLPYSFIDFSSLMVIEKLQVNFSHFFEAYNHHNYFNQKLYIDKFGNIKNGLTNIENIGNIDDLTIRGFIKLINSKKNRHLWNIKKDDTLVCNECEFRFMCTDPRVPEQNVEGKWYHKKECNYNPYISKWKNEKGYKTLVESGVILNEQGVLKIDEKTLSETFENTWY